MHSPVPLHLLYSLPIRLSALDSSSRSQTEEDATVLLHAQSVPTTHNPTQALSRWQGDINTTDLTGFSALDYAAVGFFRAKDAGDPHEDWLKCMALLKQQRAVHSPTWLFDNPHALPLLRDADQAHPHLLRWAARLQTQRHKVVLP